MLLRRFTQHIREQNWVAIVLDFLIVVLGVFIGVQVANWNDTKQKRALYNQALERVYAELKDNADDLTGLNETLKTNFIHLNAVKENLSQCEGKPDMTASLETGYIAAMQSFEYVVSTKAITQIIDNPVFLTFQTQEIRDQLLGVLTQIRQYELLVEKVHNSNAISSPQWDRFFKPGPTRNADPEQLADDILTGQPAWEMQLLSDPPPLCQNSELITLFSQRAQETLMNLAFNRFAIQFFYKQAESLQKKTHQY